MQRLDRHSDRTKDIIYIIKIGYRDQIWAKNLATLDNEIPYALDDVKGNFTTNDLKEKPWYEVLKVAERERICITSVRRMGEKILTDKPRIKISTIHKAKGGEADNVALVLDTSKACAGSRDQDSEIRTFYVGMTRAKKQYIL